MKEYYADKMAVLQRNQSQEKMAQHVKSENNPMDSKQITDTFSQGSSFARVKSEGCSMRLS